MSKTIEDVRCQLTAEEVLLKSKELTQLMRERAQVDADKKSSVSLYKDIAEKLEERIEVLANAVHSGEELRPVECIERFRYSDGMVDVVRIDTGAVYRMRPMHPEERQTALDVESQPRAGRRDPEGAH